MTTTRSITAIASLAAILGLTAGVAEAKCPPGLGKRHPLQVVADLRAALAAQDWEAVACNYLRTAFLIDDQGFHIGPEEIVASYVSYHDLFGGAQPLITEEEAYERVVRTLYQLDGGWVVIEDGVDTYHIANGRIRFQTRHGLLTFTGPPPQ